MVGWVMFWAVAGAVIGYLAGDKGTSGAWWGFLFGVVTALLYGLCLLLSPLWDRLTMPPPDAAEEHKGPVITDVGVDPADRRILKVAERHAVRMRERAERLIQRAQDEPSDRAHRLAETALDEAEDAEHEVRLLRERMAKAAGT